MSTPADPGLPDRAGDGRTVVVTGSVAGIGAATRAYLEACGTRVIGVDLRDAEIEADLATATGREAMVSAVRTLAPRGIDGIVANAGVNREDALTIRVNYFGAVATLEGLRPLLGGAAPRAFLVASRALLQPVDERILAACLAGDEAGAVRLAEELAVPQRAMLYPTSKRAVARWLRRSAVEERWAGAGIPLNAVAPGSVLTAMTAGRSAGEQAHLLRERPMPLGGQAKPADIAPVIAFLLSPENTAVTGQSIFIDGGGEVLMCGEDIWKRSPR